MKIFKRFLSAALLAMVLCLVSAAAVLGGEADDHIYLSDLSDDALLESTVGYSTLKKDTNVEGGTISLIVDGSRKYFIKGVAAHAPATLIYDVSGCVTEQGLTHFTAYTGVDASKESNGNGAIITVYTSADNEEWTLAQNTGVLKGDSEAAYLDIDLTGVNYLKFSISDNGGQSYDHTVLGGAMLCSADYSHTDQSYDFIKSVEYYDSILDGYEAGGESYTALLNNDNYRMALYQRTFVDKAGYDMLQTYANYSESYKEGLNWFLNDLEALELYINGGEPEGGSYVKSVQVLLELYSAYSGDMDSSLYKKMLITLSLTHAKQVQYWADSTMISDPVRRYEIYKRLYENGYLINNVFENLTVEEMRWVMNNISSDEEIEWLNFYVRKYYYNDMKPDLQTLNINNLAPGPYYYITYTFDYNYYLEQYYSEENKESWISKYHLVNTDDDADDDDFVLNVSYIDQHPRLWIVFEEGAVCGGISKTGSNLLTAFGVPGVVIGQPGHAAYLRYKYDDAEKTADGLGVWEIWNDVSGWTESYKDERLLAGWGNESWTEGSRVSYVLLAQAAINDEQSYNTAENLIRLAQLNEDNAEELYEAALEVQGINLDAWAGLIDVYQAQGRGDDDYLALAGRISESLKYYPLPMYQVLDKLIKPNLTTDSAISDLTIYSGNALKAAAQATADDVLQPDPCKTMAKYLLGEMPLEIAGFSFDGDNANKIVLSESFASGNNELLYSLDGGESWVSAGTVTQAELTAEEISSISAENDILVKLQGSTNYYTIDITEGAVPSGIYNNDNENRLIGAGANLEWSEDGTLWSDLDETCVFEGDRSISVRTKAAGTSLAGSAIQFAFTADTDTENRSYITLDRVSYVSCSSEETSREDNAAVNALDGNINTIWHTLWSGGDNERYIICELDEPVYLSAVEYTPRQTASNGIFTACEIYTSTDGEDWMLSGYADGWAVNADKKSVELDAPVYAKYVKIAGKAAQGGYGSAAMLELYEDSSIADKTLASIRAAALPDKTEYLTGESLDTIGLRVNAVYDDGSESLIPLSMLTFSTTSVDNEGDNIIEIGYNGFGTQITVTGVNLSDCEAYIGDTPYITLNEAVQNAAENDTILVQKDIELSSCISSSVNIKITSRDSEYFTVSRAETLTSDYLFNVTSGCLTLNNIIIDGNSVSAERALINVNGGSLEIGEGAVLKNNLSSASYAYAGGAVSAWGSSTVKLTGGCIINNRCNSYGGAVMLKNNCKLIMESGTVSGNTSGNSGAAFCVDHSSAFTMSGGSIENNSSGGAGGAVWLSDGNAAVSGGTIRNNTAANGSGFYLNGSGVLTLSGADCFTDAVYLKSGKLIHVDGSLGDNVIPVQIGGSVADDTQIAETGDDVNAYAVARCLRVDGYSSYGSGTGVYITSADLSMDINSDGNIDSADAALLLKHISGITVGEEFNAARADVNGSGNDDMLDVIEIIKAVSTSE